MRSAAGRATALRWRTRFDNSSAFRSPATTRPSHRADPGSERRRTARGPCAPNAARRRRETADGSARRLGPVRDLGRSMPERRPSSHCASRSLEPSPHSSRPSAERGSSWPTARCPFPSRSATQWIRLRPPPTLLRSATHEKQRCPRRQASPRAAQTLHAQTGSRPEGTLAWSRMSLTRRLGM